MRAIQKKKFISLVDLDGISGLELSSTIPIGVFARGQDLIVLDKFYIQVYDLGKDFARTEVIKYAEEHPIQSQFFPLKVHFSCDSNAWLFSNQPNGSQTAQKIMSDKKWEYKGKNIVTYQSAQTQGRPVNMTAISENSFLMTNASPLMQVGFIKFSELNKKGLRNAELWWLTAGSQQVKTFIDDPDFPGISKIKITPNKLVVALGNVIRAY